MKKVYSISILYFDLGKGSDYIYIGQNKFIGMHTNDELIVSAKEKDNLIRKSPSEIFPTYILIRVNEFNKVAKSPLEEWVNYLKNGVIESDTKAPGLQEARERLKYYEMSDSERHAYDEHLNAIMIQNDVLGNAKMEGIAEGMAKGMAKGVEKGMAEGLEKGRAEGIVKGREEGKVEGKLEIAKAMLAKGMSVEMIAEITGLTAEEITKTTKNF